jgi:hypothetical protein
MSSDGRTFSMGQKTIHRSLDSGDDFFDEWFEGFVDIAAIKKLLFRVWLAGRDAERAACLLIARDAMIEDENVREGSEVAKSQHETAMLIARSIEERGGSQSPGIGVTEEP